MMKVNPDFIKDENISKIALRITIILALTSGLWIITSDLLLSKISDFDNFVIFQIVKGMLFVLVISILTFYTFQKFLKILYESREKLKNSERKFSAAFHKSPQLLAITRLSDGKIVEINDGFLNISGYKKEEVIGKKTTEIGAWSSENERDKFIETYSLAGKDPNELTLRMKSGATRVFTGYYEPVEIGDETFALCTLIDITEKKQSEQKILKFNRFYSFISEINQAIIRIHDTNKLFYEICRITVEYGKLNMVWIGVLDKDTNDVIPAAVGGFVNGYLDKVRTSIKDEPEGNGMTGTAIKSGKFCVVNDIASDPKFDICRDEAFKRNYRSAIAFPIFKNNIAIGAYMLYSSEQNYFNSEEIYLLEEAAANISYAITNLEIENALKQSEARLRSFLNSNDIFMSIVELAQNDVIFSWPNQYVVDFFGISREEIKLKRASELDLSVEAIGAITAALKECYVNKRNISFEFYLFKGGRKIWFIGDVNLIEEQIHDVPKFSLAAVDITNLKDIEIKLIESREKAMEADRLKSEFLAQISHEIRSPINVILNYIYLIKDEISSSLTDDIQYSFTAIDNSARRLIRTIDLILNMAQVQTGKIELQPKVIDLNQEILIPLAAEFSSGAAAKGLELKIHSVAEPTRIKIDEYTTSHIFVNLIDNAIKYTSRGSIQITVYRNEDNFLSVDVKDTGIGISEEFIDDLFTPFRQEEGGYTRRFEGNGLGLALVKNYCDLNNAIINVESKKGEGTKFTVIFRNGSN